MTLPFRWKRVLGFWLLLFVPLYAVNFLLYAVYLAGRSPFAFAALQALTPLAYLGVGFLYYRHDGATGWGPRLAVIPVWLLLALAASAALVQAVYGYSWTSIVNFQVLQNQGANFAAMLAAAWLVSRKHSPSIPTVPVPSSGDLDALEGPKFE